MAANYDAIDLLWTWDGDYLVAGGDLVDSADNRLQPLLQEIHTVVASSTGDWENYPLRAASIDDWVGEPNTRRSAGALKDRVETVLVAAGVVRQADLEVKVVPVHIHRVLIVITIKALATNYNLLEPGMLLSVAYLFDTMEHQVVYLEREKRS